MGMNVEGIELPDDEQAFSLKKLGISKNDLKDIETNDMAYSSSSEAEMLEDSEADSEDDAEYEKVLEAQMEKLYDNFLSRRGDDVKTKKAVKRSKIAKRALAGQALVEDHALFDGDDEEYKKMINPEEVSNYVKLYLNTPHIVLSVRGSLYSCSVVKMGAQK